MDYNIERMHMWYHNKDGCYYQTVDKQIQGVIRFLHAKDKNPAQIHEELVVVYCEHVMSWKQVLGYCIYRGAYEFVGGQYY